jgi:hypothetical protein
MAGRIAKKKKHATKDECVTKKHATKALAAALWVRCHHLPASPSLLPAPILMQDAPAASGEREVRNDQAPAEGSCKDTNASIGCWWLHIRAAA